MRLMIHVANNSLVRMKVVTTGLVICCAYGLKEFYRDADPLSLAWILKPIAALLELAAGIPLNWESGVGWVNLELGVVLAPSCSGINFLVICFCMVSFQGVARIKNRIALSGWIAVSGIGSYCLAVLVNGLRVWLAVLLYQADIYSESITPGNVHLLLGVCVYYPSLFFYYCIVSRLIGKSRRSDKPLFGQVVFFIPLGWYLLITLAVPFLRRKELLTSAEFQNHVMLVGGTSLLLTLMAVLLFPVWRRWSTGPGKDRESQKERLFDAFATENSHR